MEKHEFKFTEKHHILTVDGADYEIPQRNAELEEKLRLHDEKLNAMSEYEANMELLEILFGKAKTKKMFPEGKKSNLDKLSQCADFAIGLFMAEYNRMQIEKLQKRMADVEPLLKQVSETSEAVSHIASNTELKKLKKK